MFRCCLEPLWLVFAVYILTCLALVLAPALVPDLAPSFAAIPAPVPPYSYVPVLAP